MLLKLEINILDLSYDELLIRNLKEFYEVKYSNIVNNKITSSEWEDYKNNCNYNW